MLEPFVFEKCDVFPTPQQHKRQVIEARARKARSRTEIRPHGGRVAIFRNHAKVYAGTGEAFDFAITSSANVNTNPRTENTVLTFGDDLFDFYKGFFDGINSFTRDFDDWTRWTKPTKRRAA